MVHTIVFDKWIHRRTSAPALFSIADPQIERLAVLINHELPLLRNARHLELRQVHPRLLRVWPAAVWRTRREQLLRLALPWRPTRRPFDSFARSHAAGALWTALETPGARIEQLDAPPFAVMYAPAGALRHLRVLHVHGPRTNDWPYPWMKTAGMHVPCLSTLIVTDCASSELMCDELLAMSAPRLATVVLHHVRVISARLAAFLARHAGTLATLCLYAGPALDFPRGAADGGFPRLRRLRIYIPPEYREHAHAPVLGLLPFIQSCPSIVDAAFAGIDIATERELRRLLVERRNVTRILLVGGQCGPFAVGWDVAAALPPRGDPLLERWIWETFLTDGVALSAVRHGTYKSSF